MFLASSFTIDWIMVVSSSRCFDLTYNYKIIKLANRCSIIDYEYLLSVFNVIHIEKNYSRMDFVR
ncbi:MAG: hypothetical protein CO189_04255 [candidate division Zixibacteria bacterium CG_4_9_14_3_um_filter_46_8]|nr:MAG: hypothetical protein CO189_04255 [candidate division Zixibacteria bacterium CG_4_9_14_3_um_filter_46_8]